MGLRTLSFTGFVLTLAVFLGSCASEPRDSVPLASTNTSGTTNVNGIEVPYEYDGEFYILAEDMLFYTLDDLRSYVTSPFGDDGGLEAAQTVEPEPDGFLVEGRQWPNRQRLYRHLSHL